LCGAEHDVHAATSSGGFHDVYRFVQRGGCLLDDAAEFSGDLAHAFRDLGAVKKSRELASAALTPATPRRTRALLEPGLVHLDDWWPSGPGLQVRPPEALMLGGLAYKPTSVLSLR
jgi:hypothetical protein